MSGDEIDPRDYRGLRITPETLAKFELRPGDPPDPRALARIEEWFRQNDTDTDTDADADDNTN